MARVFCRHSCGTCLRAGDDTHSRAGRTLRLVRLVPDDTNFTAASSFVLADPLTPAYPDGAMIVVGRNRPYLVVPLGNLIDERYTAHFDVVSTDLGAQRQWVRDRGGEKE